MIHLLNEFIAVVADAILPVQAGEHFADLAEQFGYSQSLVVALLEPQVPVAYWRMSGDFESFARQSPIYQNPLTQYGFAVDMPFDVPTACAALGYRESAVRAVMYKGVQDKHIVVFPVHRLGRLVLYAACGGDRPDDTPDTRAVLHAAAHATYDVMTAVAENRGLTQREAACIASTARGKSYKATGQMLGIAERTVRAAVASAKRKLRAQTQAEVIAKAMAAPQTALRPSATSAPGKPSSPTKRRRSAS
jgi:DNA-binding CsgD family transcriptional regulator